VLFDEVFRSKRFIIQGILQEAKEKSDGAKSGLYGGCGNTSHVATIFAE